MSRRMTEGEALQLLAQRAHEEMLWQHAALCLRMAAIGLYRKRSVCVRWKPIRRPHGDRRFKAAQRIVDAAIRRELLKLPRGFEGKVTLG